MNVSLIKNDIKFLSFICAILLFIAVLNCPTKYYTVLRGIIFVGAILIILENLKTKLYWAILFGLIAILFNPFYPIYFYKKLIWIPIDIISGLLFLIESVIKQSIKR